jgi:hypothetical protein
VGVGRCSPGEGAAAVRPPACSRSLRKYRRLKLSKQITKKLKAHIDAEVLGPDDLLFARRHLARPAVRLEAVVDPEALGLTDPNAKGRT